jgi:hypothetical protein
MPAHRERRHSALGPVIRDIRLQQNTGLQQLLRGVFTRMDQYIELVTLAAYFFTVISFLATNQLR